MKHVETVWAVVLLKTEFSNARKEVIDVATSKEKADQIRKEFGKSPFIRLQRYLLVETK